MTTNPKPARLAGTDGLDAWEFTGLISPRRVVRAAAVDVDGRPLNSYPLVHPVTGAEPLTPWAVHLAGPDRRYRLLCADLDAKTGAADAARDAQLLAGLFTALGVPHVVCASGPTGGRHVWIGLCESIDAELVAALAHLLKARLPTLDTAPLLNPVSGCVRPPGSPHRLGGTSRVLSGTVASLLRPTVTPERVSALVSHLAALVIVKGSGVEPASRIVATGAGMPYLPGTKRPLSASCRALVDGIPSGDLSAVLWRVLCAAAAAHWHYDDVLVLLDAPGLEHACTMRHGTTRVPRPATGSASTLSVLRRQWTRAVHAIAHAPRRHDRGDDPTFDVRADATAAVTRAVQGRADAAPGRWAGRAGLAQRRVLDALCLFHLQAVRTDDVEADIRRLSLTCGIDRETVRRSLLALAADGWITRTQASSGRRGARWTADPAGALHTRIAQTLSQADPRPAGTGAALRNLLTDTLTDRLQTAAHDAFAPTGGLGIEAGTLYGKLNEPTDTMTIAIAMGWTMTKASTNLDRLACCGLIERRDDCWRRAEPSVLDQVAAEQGTQGRGLQRAQRYAVERAAWAWWQAELDRMRQRRPRARTRPRPGLRARREPPAEPVSGGEPAGWPLHPRRRNGRADYAAARIALATLRVEHPPIRLRVA